MSCSSGVYWSSLRKTSQRKILLSTCSRAQNSTRNSSLTSSSVASHTAGSTLSSPGGRAECLHDHGIASNMPIIPTSWSRGRCPEIRRCEFGIVGQDFGVQQTAATCHISNVCFFECVARLCTDVHALDTVQWRQTHNRDTDKKLITNKQTWDPTLFQQSSCHCRMTAVMRSHQILGNKVICN